MRKTTIASELAEFGLFVVFADFGLVLLAELELRLGGLRAFLLRPGLSSG